MRVSVDTTKKKKKEEKNTPKKTFKLLWSALFKNAAVVEAKDTPWYIAVICFVLSVILSFLPPVIGAATEKGSFILTNSTYQMDIGLEAFSRFIYDNDIEFEIKKYDHYSTDVDGNYILDSEGNKIVRGYDNKLTLNTVSNWENNTKTIEGNSGETIHYFEYVSELSTGVSVPRFRVFYVPGDQDINGYTPAYRFFSDNDDFGISKQEESNPVSMMVLGTHELFIAVYSPVAKNNSEISGNSFRGYYSRMDASKGISLQTLLLPSDASEEQIESANKFESNPTFVSPSESRWIGFLNEAYSVTRINNTMMMLSLIGGINSIIILVFGFTLWILTRGKRNPNNTMKLHETIKMSCISAVSPAILSLILGFIIPSFATLSFMLLASFRLMWLSMKTLRPSYDN